MTSAVADDGTLTARPIGGSYIPLRPPLAVSVGFPFDRAAPESSRGKTLKNCSALAGEASTLLNFR